MGIWIKGGDFMPQSILELVYTREFFDLSLMTWGARKIISISNDGTIVCKEFKADSRKAHSIRNEKCSSTEFRKLCQEIMNCIETADRNEFFVDDSSAELKIYHEFGRIQTMDRGLGNDNTNISYIMAGFFEKHLK